MKNRSIERIIRPRVGLLMLVLLVCALGSNQPIEPVSTGQVPDPGALSVSCPAYDPSVFPPDLGVSSTSATLPTIPGSFAVSRTGEATYSIPLVVPPGRAGMEPSLAITYGSAAGEGLLGVGFGLQGLGAVTRCPANQAQDGFIRPVKYDEQDHLCLDGARLVQVAAQLAFDGSSTREYRTVPDTFTKVVGHFAPGFGPQSFEAYTRAGRIVEYGSTADSRAMATNQVVAAWWVSKERDRHGNAVTYAYDNATDPGDGHTLEITPARIEYAHRSDGTASRAVVFETSGTPSTSTRFSAGMKLLRSRELSQINMMLEPGDVAVRSYALSYDTSKGTGRTLLQFVSECAGPGGGCKVDTSFTWSSHAGGFTKTATPVIVPSGTVGAHRALWLMADVNGDGLDDLVMSIRDATHHGIDNWTVALNTGSGFAAPKLWLSFEFPPTDTTVDEEWTATALDYDQDGLTDIFLDTPNPVASAWPRYRWLHAKPDHTFELLETAIPYPPGAPADPTNGDAFTVAHNRFARLGDVNGDGVADLIQCVHPSFDPDHPGGHWTVNLWSPSLPGGPGFDPQAITIPGIDGVLDCAWGTKRVYVVDIDGDGASEILVPNVYGTYDALRYTAGGWISTDTSLQQLVSWRTVHFLDLNGDGLPDALYTGLGCADPNPVEHPCLGDLPGLDGPLSGDLPFKAINTGAGLPDITSTLPASLAPPGDWTDFFGDEAVPIDYNGDGRMDLLLLVQGHCGANADPQDACWVVLQSDAAIDGYMTVIDTLIPSVAGDGSTLPRWYLPLVTDVNGDGRQDVVVPDPNDDGTFAIYKNSGPQDLLTAVFDGTNPLDPWDPAAIPNVAIHYGNLVDQGITKGIAPAALAHDDLTYVAKDDPNNDCTYPRACVKGAERVVRSYTVNNGQNEKRQFYVKYRDGRYHRLGRGFLGFGERIIIDGDTAGGTAELYDNITYDATFDAFPFAGQVVRSWAWSATRPHWLDPGQVEMTFTARSLEQVPTNLGSTYFTLPVSTSVTRQEGTMQPGSGKSVLRFVKAAEASPLLVLGQSSSAVLDHDDFGNVLYESSDADGVDLHNTVTRTYDNDPATWLVGRMKTEVACSTSLAMTQCRSTQLDHDSHGDVKSALIGDPGDPGTQLTLGFWRDAFGHVTRTTADDAFGHQRTSCVTYDGDHLFPHASGDALGHLSYTRFDPAFGVITAAVDANGLATQWRRDAFGSVTEELRADGTRTTVAVARGKDGGPQGKWFNATVTTKEDGGAVSTTELDAVGRPVHSWTVAAEVRSCGATSCAPALQLEQETQYDRLGRVARATLPWMSGDSLQGKAFHTYHYDVAGRLTEHTEPWGRVTSFAYGGHLASSTDWLGTTTVEVDGLGRPVKVTDKKGYATETTYGPFGATWAVKRTGNEITWSERDAYGRVIREVDPDRGETDVAYDGFGEAVTMDDALGRHGAFIYDALGRLVQRDDPDGTVRWEYDTAANGIGKIASVINAGSVKQHAYDMLSRPAMVALTLTDTGDKLHAGFDYDSRGRLQMIAYPQVAGVDPLVVRREYDTYGNLVAVHDNANGKVYWRLRGLDGAGRPAVETMGSGVTARHDYDPYTGLVQRIRAGTRDAPLLEDLTYTYDKGLRMASRADHLQVGPAGVRTELFAHDELGRLTCSLFADVPSGHRFRGDCPASITYDPSGNITSKSDVGAYAYDPAHPHAVQTAGAGSYGYDAVGNQITRPDAGITYTAFDLPSVVTPTGGDPAVSFSYDGDQHRIRKQSSAQETVYFEDLYERVGSSATGGAVHRYYVAAGSATVVLTRQAGGNDKVAYLHADALGSTDVVTDGKGNVAGSAGERRSYDAFGARRNPAWGQPAPAGFASKASPMGFTGHEGDDELGLINMRGRIYDPRLGRFLSTDPIVSRPHFGQSWNPYSYVLNSPLNFVDPTGFDGVGTYANLGGVQGQFPSPDVRGMVADPSSGTPPAVAPPSGNPDTNWVPPITPAPIKDAARDDTTGGAAPAPAASPAEPPGSAPDPSARASRAERLRENGIGMLRGVGHMALDLVTNWCPMCRGYQRDGALGAVNAINPLYGTMIAGIQAQEADARGDQRAVGEASLGVALGIFGMVAGVVEFGGAALEVAPGAGVAAEEVGTVARVNELRAAIPAAQKGRITMAVGLAEDAGGIQRVLIGTSEAWGFRKQVLAILRPKEIRVSGAGHAEVNVVNYAQSNGLRLLEVGATRPICTNCAASILESGAQPVTPLK